MNFKAHNMLAPLAALLIAPLAFADDESEYRQIRELIRNVDDFNRTLTRTFESSRQRVSSTRITMRKNLSDLRRLSDRLESDSFQYRQDLTTGLAGYIDILDNFYNNEWRVLNNSILDIARKLEPHENSSQEAFEEISDNVAQQRRKVNDTLASLRNDMARYSTELNATGEAIRRQNEEFRELITKLATQTMHMRYQMEEKVRSDGCSGVKLTRGLNKGPNNYYESGVVGRTVNQIHDHSNYDRTVGMGEIVVVMNGVEFRTRHNDYKLTMPSTTSGEYHAMENIPFPDVPPEVLSLPNVTDQITEMREWFKAFADQNHTVRDYRRYFKPVLCYIEANWDLKQDMEEPFSSDRHHIDANSWFQLQEKTRFATYTGTKDRLENFALLPTKLHSVNNITGLPVYAQWTYRILCQPIHEDIPTKEFKQMDDLAQRVPKQKTEGDMKLSRGARFALYTEEDSKNPLYTKLDRIMATIPGLDNIPGNLSMPSLGDDILDHDGNPLNTHYYNRHYTFAKPDANGRKHASRGFNDGALWVAQTTQSRVAPVPLEVCTDDLDPLTCRTVDTRVSYAMPLEIVYLTPLLKWNPYNLPNRTKEEVRGINFTRNGTPSPEKAYNGTSEVLHFYRTPVEFYVGRLDQSDPADTVRKWVNVMDANGTLRKVTASGTQIFMQDLEGVGPVRLRYPIPSFHAEGSPVWKELNALKDLVKEAIGINSNSVNFIMTQTYDDPPGEHTHEFHLELERFRQLVSGDASNSATVWTSRANGHKHSLKIRVNLNTMSFYYFECDEEPLCPDNHPRAVFLITDPLEINMALGEDIMPGDMDMGMDMTQAEMMMGDVENDFDDVGQSMDDIIEKSQWIDEKHDEL